MLKCNCLHLIVSFDSIMNPPYEITPAILKLVSSISEQLGIIKATHLIKPQTELRKKNTIKTIQSSLEIEGNTLTVEQITALVDNKRVMAPAKDIQEVKNAIQVYDNIKNYKLDSVKDFKKAHLALMKHLIDSPGEFRKTEVGVVKGSRVQHLAPPGEMVNGLMTDLFKYLKQNDEIPLIKSCVFHYELEFIHPFIDGNGRMGRLWQTIILMNYNFVFQYLPIEWIIKERQDQYYKSLSISDKTGQATPFVEFMLQVINEALEIALNSQRPALSKNDRLMIFKESNKNSEFSRQDYLKHFKEISSATGSRDLKFAVEEGIIQKSGYKRMTKYNYN
ncbi:MAG: Fic family protein [Cyclobacteriaceae bacterium]|jgi:Fic family protein